MLTIAQFWGIFYETFSKFSCYLVSITVFSTELVLYSSEQYFTHGLHLHWWALGTSLIEPTLKRYWKHFVKNFPPVSYLLVTDVTPTCHHRDDINCKDYYYWNCIRKLTIGLQSTDEWYVAWVKLFTILFPIGKLPVLP